MDALEGLPDASSDPRRAARAADAACTCIGLVTFVVLAVASAALWKLTPAASARMRVADAVWLPAADNYLAGTDTLLDHRVLYRGLFGTLEPMRRADVLFLGNSRLMFGLSEPLLSRFFEERGLRYYMLGFGYGEGNRFAEDLIARHDLRPQLVVANVDRFFTNQYSDFGASVVAETAFGSWKVLLETNAAFVVRHGLHRFLPHVPDLCRGTLESFVFRSKSNGSWRVPYPMPTTRHPLPPPPADPASTERPGVAARFQAELEARGARVLLTYVPTPDGSRQPAENVAARLGVPLLAPELPGLETFDDSHLTPQSSERFTAAFLEELGRELEQRPLSSRP